MGFWATLGRWFGGGGEPPSAYVVKLRCGRCGEVVAVRIDPRSQASAEYADGQTRYVLRKVAVGSRCPHRMELQIVYDGAFRELQREVQGGEVYRDS